MMRRLLLTSLLVAVAVTSAVSSARAKDRWIHIAVDERGGRGDDVRITLPFDLVEALAPILHSGSVHTCRVRFEGIDCDGTDLRMIWDAVRTRKDGEFVTVEDGDERIRVAKKGGHLIVRTDERRGRGHVDARIPLPIVDALLSGDGDELDLPAAIRALGRQGSGDLVVVDEEDTTVRIWVDGKKASD